MQVTIDEELDRALEDFGAGVPRSRAIRNLAVRGAKELRLERERRTDAIATLDRIASGEDDGFDFGVTSSLHRERR